MILSVAPIGEYDKRVVILTKEKGKISAFAKGARRPNGPLAGACTPCNFGKFMLYEGRNSNTLQSAEIENYFAELRTDVEAAYYAFYFLEFADFYTREANDEREMHSMPLPHPCAEASLSDDARADEKDHSI